MLAHPEVAGRSCKDCATWLYNEDGTPTVRAGGKRMPRPPGMPTPCHTCPKIPAGQLPVPENARELTPQLMQVYMHYRKCRAVGRFPIHPHGEDAMVVDHADMIAEVERGVEEIRFRRLELALTTAVGIGAMGRTTGGGGQ